MARRTESGWRNVSCTLLSFCSVPPSAHCCWTAQARSRRVAARAHHVHTTCTPRGVLEEMLSSAGSRMAAGGAIPSRLGGAFTDVDQPVCSRLWNRKITAMLLFPGGNSFCQNTEQFKEQTGAPDGQQGGKRGASEPAGLDPPHTCYYVSRTFLLVMLVLLMSCTWSMWCTCRARLISKQSY